uniref:Uncharacterized protein n=1 Tax=Ixodes ricinus TaxID=34613 RepID=A0A0K8RIH7_IXORI
MQHLLKYKHTRSNAKSANLNHFPGRCGHWAFIRLDDATATHVQNTWRQRPQNRFATSLCCTKACKTYEMPCMKHHKNASKFDRWHTLAVDNETNTKGHPPPYIKAEHAVAAKQYDAKVGI